MGVGSCAGARAHLSTQKYTHCLTPSLYSVIRNAKEVEALGVAEAERCFGSQGKLSGRLEKFRESCRGDAYAFTIMIEIQFWTMLNI